jgi:hypothetical protein
MIDTDERVVTLLAEHITILLPACRRPPINFHVCVFAPQNYSHHIIIAKIFWAYNLPLQHSSATRELYQFVSW